MQLLSILEGVFRSRGYEVVKSSSDNRYLLLKREGSTLAVGYCEEQTPVTEGEADMFINMAVNDSADSRLFISPVKLSREARRVLESSEAATWDRMALAIAVGEEALSKAFRGEIRPEAVEIPGQVLETPPPPPPLGDSVIAPAVAREDGDFKVTEVAIGKGSGMGPERHEVEASLAHIENKPGGHPLAGGRESIQATKKPPISQNTVPEQLLLDIFTGLAAEQAKEAPPQVEVASKPQPASPPATQETKAEGPWFGAILAPARFSREDACTAAGANHDSDLQKVHIPHLLVHVSYRLRSESGETVERRGHYLYDPVGREALDLPEPLFLELEVSKETWKAAEPLEGPGGAPEEDGGHLRAIRTKLKDEVHWEDRLVRESLMSTIYQEMRFYFDPSSFTVSSMKRVMVPFWRSSGGESASSWSFDAYLGRYIPAPVRTVEEAQ